MSSETKWRSSRRWKKEIPTGPLSLAEYELFRRRQTGVWKALGIVAVHALCCGLLFEAQTRFGLPVSGPIVALTTFPLYLCCVLVLMAFKCPRCEARPKTKNVSLTTSEVEYGSYVAFNPKSCGKCGVQFVKPAEDMADAPSKVAA